MIQDVSQDDVFFFVNTGIYVNPYTTPLFATPIIATPIVLALITYLTHKKIMSEMREISAENDALQRSITLLLFGQVGAPYFLSSLTFR